MLTSTTMFRPTALISDEYRALQTEMHLHPRGYGGKGARWADTVQWVARRFDAHSVLDYGCGQGTLARALEGRGMVCREYDPAIAGKDALPAFADVVVCTDVLEHIEPEKLPTVLKHIDGLARKAIFLVVSLRDANKLLPDGRNAHLIVKPAAWWEAIAEQEGWQLPDVSDMPIPEKVSPAKAWVAVALPRR